MTEKTSDEDLRKKLDNIRKKLVEIGELDAEASRRFQVADKELAGWLIECIESQRGKLKEKKKRGRLLAILLRTTDLRGNALIYYSQYLSSTATTRKVLPMLHAISKMTEAYEGIRTDLSGFLYEEDSKMSNLLISNLHLASN